MSRTGSPSRRRRWYQRRRSDYLSALGFCATTAFFVVGFVGNELPPWWLLLAALWLAVGAPAADRLSEGVARWLADRYGPR